MKYDPIIPHSQQYGHSLNTAEVSPIRETSVTESMQSAANYLDEAHKAMAELRFRLTGLSQGESADAVASSPTIQSVAQELSTSAASLLGDIRSVLNLLGAPQ